MKKLVDYFKVWYRIRRDSLSNLFTTHQYVDDCGFVDFLFLGKHNGKRVIWNATMTTTKGDYYDEAHSKALEEGFEKYPSTHNFTDCFVKIEGTKTSRYVDPEPETTKKRMSYIAKRTLEIIDSGEISVDSEQIEIDESYKFGVGLYIRKNVERINVKDVEQFISDFNWKGSELRLDHTPVKYDSDELGVELSENEMVVIWKNNWSHNTVGVNL